MLRAIASAAITLGLLGTQATSAREETPKRYIETPTGYLVVLREGDDVFASLADLAIRESIPSASITGIGFLRKVTFGYYDFAKQMFEPQTFTDVEMTALSGSIAWKEGKPSVHAHATVAGADFKAHGGHLLSLEVGTGSVEITVVKHDQRLERKTDPSIGADVLSL
jgi:uncharacterized protein